LTSYQANSPISVENYTQGTGTSSSDPFIPVLSNRDPTPQDFNYPVKKRWINTATVDEWILLGFTNISGSSLANWLLLSSQGTDLITLSDNAAVKVLPIGNNIQLTGQLNEQAASSPNPFQTIVGDVGNHSINFNPMSAARWIVDPLSTGTRPNGTHTTIASAVAAASNGDTILIMPGVFSENIDLDTFATTYVGTASLNITAMPGDENNLVAVFGKWTCTSAKLVTITNIDLITNADYFLSVTGSTATQINLQNCFLNCSNFTGINYASSSAGSEIQLIRCRGDVGNAAAALYSHSSAGVLKTIFTDMTSSGASTTASNSSAGATYHIYANWNIPIATSGTGQIQMFDCEIVGNANVVYFDHTSTVGGCVVRSSLIGGAGGAAAINIGAGASLQVTNSTIGSSATNAITGTGTLAGSALEFPNSSGVISTLTVVPDVFGIRGTWTPTVDGTVSGATTYTTQVGHYTIIGKICFVRFSIGASAATGTGDMVIGGLPYTIKNQANANPAGNISIVSNMTWPAGTTDTMLQGVINTTTAKIYCTGSGTAGSFMQIANTTITLTGSLTYEID
jgi:hypothetical protein